MKARRAHELGAPPSIVSAWMQLRHCGKWSGHEPTDGVLRRWLAEDADDDAAAAAEIWHGDAACPTAKRLAAAREAAEHRLRLLRDAEATDAKTRDAARQELAAAVAAEARVQ